MLRLKDDIFGLSRRPLAMVFFAFQLVVLSLSNGFLLVGCSSPPAANPELNSPQKAPVSARKVEKNWYEGSDLDLKLMRQTVLLENPHGLHASAPAALQAAQRFFSNVSLLGLRKYRVLEILGDPKTISDYGEAQDGPRESPLVYRFDTGYGGVEYWIFFAGSRVYRVESRAILR